MFAELRGGHFAEELQLGYLADAPDVLRGHARHVGLQIVRDVVEDFLVRIETPVAPLGIRRHAGLRTVLFRIPVTAAGVVDGYLELHVLAVRFLDTATDDHVGERLA